jgi:hypothetical protein
MLRYNQKTGDFSLAPGALACLIAGVFGFGGWMTKMQYDVSGWYDVAARVKNIERVLIYNRLDAPDILGGPIWPDPSLPSPYWPALVSSQAVVTKRE